jgi:Protein of unknown function (DUF2637)
MTTGRIIKWSTALAVLGVAAVAAVASYEDAYELVRAHGESGRTARLVPLTVDGLICATSMVMLDSARRRMPVPALARWLLGLGITATLAANVAHGLGDGPSGAAVAAWPAVALVGSYELLMVVIRYGQVPACTETGPAISGALVMTRCGRRLLKGFAGDVAAGRVPSVRMIAPDSTSGSRVRSGPRVPNCACQHVEARGSRSGQRRDPVRA